MKIKRLIFLTALAAPLLLSGCLNPAMFKKGAYSIDDWESWIGWNDSYGRYEIREGRLYYYSQPNQDSSLENPSGSAYPGLIAAKELTGQNWRLEFKAVPSAKAGAEKSFFTYVWFGDEAQRPVPAGAKTVFRILLEQRFEAGASQPLLIVSYGPGGKMFKLPKNALVFRLERTGGIFKAFYSSNGKSFADIFEAEAPQTLSAASQKVAIGAKAGDGSDDAFCEYEYIKINGQSLVE